MKKIVVVGIGNRLMGDDGIGVYIVEELKRQGFLARFEYIIGETDTDFWVSQVLDNDLVILVDAAVTGGAPGAVSAMLPDDSRFVRFSAHQFNPSQVRNIRRLVWIGVEPATVEYQFGLSEELKKVFGQIVEETKQYIFQFATDSIDDKRTLP